MIQSDLDALGDMSTSGSRELAIANLELETNKQKSETQRKEDKKDLIRRYEIMYNFMCSQMCRHKSHLLCKLYFIGI